MHGHQVVVEAVFYPEVTPWYRHKLLLGC